MDIGAKLQVAQPVAANNQNARPDMPVMRKSEVIAEPVQIPNVPNIDMRAAEDRRMQAVKEGLRNSDMFVVSDRTFTIYKDTGGQYITRYTSLRDGSITYVPEVELTRNAPDAPLFGLDA